MKDKTPSEPGRSLAREALRRAPGPTEPDLTRILASMPGLMVEARRRRGTALAPPLDARAWGAIPKLAAVTAAAVVLASIALFVDSGSSASDDPSNVDSLILDTGDGSSGDALLDALVAVEQNGG